MTLIRSSINTYLQNVLPESRAELITGLTG